MNNIQPAGGGGSTVAVQERPAAAVMPVGADVSDARIVIVDDEPLNCKVVRKYLTTVGYQHFQTITESREAFARILEDKPDVVLLDIMMPEVSGIDILRRIRSTPETAALPVLILTASNDRDTRQEALGLGATDFLAKPVDPSELLPRVRNAILVKRQHDRLARHADSLEEEVRLRTRELAVTRLEVVHCLGRAAEYRDNDTGHHVVRVGKYAGIISRGLGLDAHTVETIELASPLHDVGKIGIPDAILLKPDKLSPEEFEIMQTHCSLGKRVFDQLDTSEVAVWCGHSELGSKIIGDQQYPLMRMAARIALTHHEKWDGSGYPLRLAGEDIPLEGRITAVADVFDALSSKRPYKPPFPREKCFSIMREGSGAHFDPKVLDAFFAHSEAIIDTQIQYGDA